MYLFNFPSQALSNAGVVAGFDMTPEAALSKLSYVLAKQDISTEEKKKVKKMTVKNTESKYKTESDNFASPRTICTVQCK